MAEAEDESLNFIVEDDADSDNDAAVGALLYESLRLVKRLGDNVWRLSMAIIY